MAIFCEVEVKLWPEGIEPILIPYDFHLECGALSHIDAKLFHESDFIGKVEVF